MNAVDRDAQIRAFLKQTGWGDAARRRLAGDASFRRYERLRSGQRRAVLMDAPPPREDVRPYMAVAQHLHQLGFSAPRIEAADVAAGLLLIEDFGDDTYSRLLADQGDEAALYEVAVDLLIALHRHPQAAGIDLPPYDEARLLDEAALLTDWYVPAIKDEPTPPAVRAEYLDLWRDILAGIRGLPDTLVLRDYHVDNLMLLSGREGVAACGLLDFQDAVIGPVSYDLVSLLEDARRDIDPGLVSKMTVRYLDAFPDLDRAAFAASYAALGAQRNCKIIGIFTRLLIRDGKPAYLTHIPRVWRLLEGDVDHPALAPIKAWLDEHIPPGVRRAPAIPDEA